VAPIDRQSDFEGCPLADRLTPALLVSILIGHALFGLLLDKVPLLSSVHCIGILLFGVGAAFFSKKIAPIAWLMAYIVGAEVLWRMTDSQMPYESAKYAVAVISAVTLIRIKNYAIPNTAVVYFLLLLPALIMSYGTLSREALRAGISFNFSGPLSLFAAVCFFANITLNSGEWKVLLLAVVAPMMGITTIAAHGTFLNPDIQFTTESVHKASGGFGPNQVSSVLGLGALLAAHYAMNSQNRRKQAVLICAALFFMMQATLTFSRGGVIAAVLALAPAVFFKLGQSRGRGRLLIWVAILAAFCGLVVYPLLDDYTGGALTVRYSIKDLNGREQLMAADLVIWESSPIFGVGVGGSAHAHMALYGQPAATHNEFTRLLAEHGLFGVGAILAMAMMAVSAFIQAPTAQEKSYVSSFILWSILFSGANSMRVAAAGFIFGLAFVRLKQLYRRPEPIIDSPQDASWPAQV